MQISYVAKRTPTRALPWMFWRVWRNCSGLCLVDTFDVCCNGWQFGMCWATWQIPLSKSVLSICRLNIHDWARYLVDLGADAGALSMQQEIKSMISGILWYPVANVGQVWEGTTERWTAVLRIHVSEFLSNGVWNPPITYWKTKTKMHAFWGPRTVFSNTSIPDDASIESHTGFQDTAYDIAIQQFGKKELRAQICIRYLWSFGKKSGSKAKSSPDHHPTFVAQDSCFLQARPPCALFLQRGTTQPTG